MSSKYRAPKYTFKPFNEEFIRTIPTLEELGIFGFKAFQDRYYKEYHSLSAKHQDEWAVMIDGPDKYLGWNEPRYAGKSITLSTEYPTYKMVQDYNSAGLLVTASDKLSKTYNRAIVDAMKTNPGLVKDFHTDWWFDMKKGREGFSAHEIFLKRHIMRREPSFMTAGVGSQIIGFHPDYIIIDDVIQSAKDRTGLRGEDLVNWFNSVIIPMQPDRFLTVGTRKAPDDIYQHLIDLGIFEWSSRKALSRIPNYEVKFIDKKKHIVILEKDLITNPSRKIKLVYWPERYTLEDLLLIRETIGKEAFSGEFQNEPVPAQGLVFSRDWLEFFSIKDFVRSRLFERCNLYTCIDPGGPSKYADWTAIVTIAVTPNNHIYVIDVKVGHWRVPDIIREAGLSYYKFQDYHKLPLQIGVETSFFQISIMDFIKIDRHSLLPWVELRPTEKKTLRIDSCGSYFQRHLIHVSEELQAYDEFLNEYLSYDPEKSKKRAIKDDVLDCLQQVIQMALYLPPAFLGVSYD